MEDLRCLYCCTTGHMCSLSPRVDLEARDVSGSAVLVASSTKHSPLCQPQGSVKAILNLEQDKPIIYNAHLHPADRLAPRPQILTGSEIVCLHYYLAHPLKLFYTRVEGLRNVYCAFRKATVWRGQRIKPSLVSSKV